MLQEMVIDCEHAAGVVGNWKTVEVETVGAYEIYMKVLEIIAMSLFSLQMLFPCILVSKNHTCGPQASFLHQRAIHLKPNF